MRLHALYHNRRGEHQTKVIITLVWQPETKCSYLKSKPVCVEDRKRGHSGQDDDVRKGRGHNRKPKIDDSLAADAQSLAAAKTYGELFFDLTLSTSAIVIGRHM